MRIAGILCASLLAVAPARSAELTVTPGTLAFVGVKDGATPAAQKLEIGTPEQNGTAWTASEATAWLAVTPALGVTPADPDVTIVDFASVATGTHEGEITVTAEGATGSPRKIPVTLDVLAEAALLARPSKVDFVVTEGQTSTGGAVVKILYPYTSIAWTATTSTAWLAVSPASGTTPGTPSISVTNSNTLATGTHQGSVTFAETTTGTSATVAVTLVVQPKGGVTCGDDAWYCVAFDTLAQRSINGQAGWISHDEVAEAQVAADPRGTGKVLLLDPPTGETSVDEVTVTDQSIDLTEIALQVRLNNLPSDQKQVGKLEFYTSGNAWGKTQRTFGAIRMAGGVLYFQYGANIYRKIVDDAVSGRFYDIKVRFRDAEIDVLVDGVSRFKTANPVADTQSVQAFVATGWGASGSASIDMLQARTMPATAEAELFVDPEVLNLSSGPAASAQAADAVPAYASGSAPATIPMAFEPNVGQADGAARYVARGAGYAVRIADDGAELKLPANRSVALRLVGARPSEPRGEHALPGRSHYLIGSDPSRWKRGVPHFGRVRSRQVYPGIDAVFYGNERRLEYDFEVAPGADPRSIRLSFEGARAVLLDEQGDLIVATAGGDLRQHRPIAFQPAGSRRDPVHAGYVLHGDGAVSVRVAAYDSTRPLVIDPVLSYSTKLGGGANDQAVAIAVDADGNTYVAGHTTSTDFPVETMIQPQKSTTGTDTDAFITKLNASGTAIVHSTYLGGGAPDQATALAVDATGAIYVAGITGSTDFPVRNARQSTRSGATHDGFLARIEADGAELGFATYLGADAAGGATWASGVRVHGGKVFVGGATLAATLAGTAPTRVNDAPVGGGTNPFVARLTPDGQTIDTLVYLNSDCAIDVSTTQPQLDVDADGDVFVSGTMTGCSSLPAAADRASHPFPISSTGWLAAHGDAGVFVTKLDADALDSVVYSSLFGGSGTELARALAVGPDGAAYVAGSVGAPGADAVEFPTTTGAVWTAHSGAGTDGFLTKLRADGTGAAYSTHLGRSAVSDVMRAVAVDAAGRAYVAGNSTWSSFPAETCGAKGSYGGVTGTAVLVKVAPDGTTLEDCTFLGPAGVARGVALDAAGAAYVTGSGAPNDFITTTGAFQSSGTDEAFVARLSSTAPGPLALLQFSHAQFGAAENAGQATVTVTRTGRTDNAVEVTCGTADGTAGGLDYTGTVQRLTFAADETSRTLPVRILDDALPETTETIQLQLSSPSASAGLGSQRTAVLSLLDDDVAPGGTSGTFVIRHRDGSPGPAWTASTTTPWLSLSALSGTGPSTVTATASVAGLAVGSHEGTITITSDGTVGSPKTILVKLVVAAP